MRTVKVYMMVDQILVNTIAGIHVHLSPTGSGEGEPYNEASWTQVMTHLVAEQRISFIDPKNRLEAGTQLLVEFDVVD